MLVFYPRLKLGVIVVDLFIKYSIYQVQCARPVFRDRHDDRNELNLLYYHHNLCPSYKYPSCLTFWHYLDLGRQREDRSKIL